MKFLTVFMLLLLLVGINYGQRTVTALDVIRPEYITVALDSSTTSTVYYIYPPPAGENSGNRTAISTTAPTSASLQAINKEYNAKGALTIAIVTDSSTAEESDSLYISVATLWYDETKASWYTSNNDIQYLDFDTQGTYVNPAIQYLDWTHGTGYTADLGSQIMPGAGLTVVVGQVANDNAGAASNVYLSFWWVR
jgi:hypothetical protein